MIKKTLKFFKHISNLGKDFTDEGFIYRNQFPEPTKIFFVPKMWIGNGGISSKGWRAGIKKCIIRCYKDGFSFWHGKIEDHEEWFAYYKDIQGFKQPLGISVASPILILKNKKGTIECMLGEGTEFIKSITRGNDTEK